MPLCNLLIAENVMMSSSSMEEKLRALMIFSLDGDQEAYKLFLTQVSNMMRSYLFKKTNGNNETVEDLVQEVLLIIHIKKSSYRKDLPVLPWIYTIAKHRFIDEVRSASRKSRLIHSWSDQLVEELLHPDLTGESFLDDTLEVDKILSLVNEKQKKILYSAKVENVPLKQIAEQMKMSLSAVKITVHRAVNILKLQLPQKGEIKKHENK